MLSSNLKVISVLEVKKNGDGMTETDEKPRRETWIVMKFRGQKETSAGMAFYNTSRVPPVDVVLSHGVYFKDLREFREKMKRERPELKLFILDETHFKTSGFDSTIFQGFADKFIDSR